jgi:hypothetical protein
MRLDPLHEIARQQLTEYQRLLALQEISFGQN